MIFDELIKNADSKLATLLDEARWKLREADDMLHEEELDYWMEGILYDDFPILREANMVKFIPGVVRIYLANDLESVRSVDAMGLVLNEIERNHYDEYDSDLNGKYCRDLYLTFWPDASEDSVPYPPRFDD